MAKYDRTRLLEIMDECARCGKKRKEIAYDRPLCKKCRKEIKGLKDSDEYKVRRLF